MRIRAITLSPNGKPQIEAIAEAEIPAVESLIDPKNWECPRLLSEYRIASGGGFILDAPGVFIFDRTFDFGNSLVQIRACRVIQLPNTTISAQKLDIRAIEGQFFLGSVIVQEKANRQTKIEMIANLTPYEPQVNASLCKRLKV